MDRRPFIAGNWKMYKTVPEAIETATGLRNAVQHVSGRDIVIAPPSVSVTSVAEAIKGSNIILSGQNVFWEEQGAYTGEVSPSMLLSAGCSYSIVGHSERRQYFGETDETVNKKIKACLKAGLNVIACIGETLRGREEGKTFTILETQVAEGLHGLEPADVAAKVIIAYEPVWAIGTGKTATAGQAEEAHQFIRNQIGEKWGADTAEDIRILYGGSVKPDNIDELMNQKDIDGVLVGGASLTVDSFARIVAFQEKT